MTQEEKATIKEKITADMKKLEIQINILKEKTQPVAPDCSLGRLTRAEALNEQMMNKKVLSESTLTLTRLHNAQKRIDHKMFGICIECEENISIGRMMVRPQSVRCVSCAI